MITKNIKIKDNQLRNLENITLPPNLKYKIPHSGLTSNSLDTHITSNGNLGHAFSIYIFPQNNIAYYRISFYTFSTLRYLSINVYKNKTAYKATLSNIDEYHKTSDAINHIGWIKE